MSPAEPQDKRAVVFIDGQNLFHAAREAFGYTYPNYDVLALARHICNVHGWVLTQTRFYTGIPDLTDNPFWHRFWEAKLRAISWQGVHIFKRSLRYRNKSVKLPDGTIHTFLARADLERCRQSWGDRAMGNLRILRGVTSEHL